MKALSSQLSALSLALCLLASATAQQPINVQKGGAAGTNNITADLNIGTGRTLTGAAGSTITASGTLGGTPTGGTLNLTNVTLTLPAATSGLFQPIDSDLTSWAAVTRASGFDTFTATPSGANLASLLTTALPASKGGTGLTALSANVVTLLGAADYSAFKTSLSLNSVENTALSTWAGTANITTLGTIGTGTWQGTVVGVVYGGSGRATATTAYALLAAGTTATGAHQTLAAGATTEILVGGGASALPIWTTAQGSGAPVRATSPTLTTPVLGVATATSINGLTLTSSTGTFTLTNAKTFAVTNTLTLSGTDSTVMTFPSTSATIARTDAANTFTGTQTITTLAGTNTITSAAGSSFNAATGTSGTFMSVASATNIVTLYQGLNTGGATASATYGANTLGGAGTTIMPDLGAKLQIGRYSAGAPNSYLKIGSTSSGLRVSSADDSADLVSVVNGTLSTGYFQVFTTTASTSTTTGSGVFGGGLGVAGAGYFGGALNVTGAATFATGVTMVTGGSSSVDVGYDARGSDMSLRINAAAGNRRVVQLMTAGLARWNVGANTTAETGSDAGSNFVIESKTDAGAALATPVTITRSSSLVTLSAALSVGTNLTLSSTALITKPGGTIPLITTNTAITDGAGASTGTLTNAPATGNPTKWVRIDDNGTIRYLPAW